MLLLVGYHSSIEVTLSPLTLEHEACCLPCAPVVECHQCVREVGVALLLYVCVRYESILQVSLLQSVDLQVGVLLAVYLDHLCCEEVLVVRAVVAEEYVSLGVPSGNYEHTAVDHHADIAPEDIHHLYRAVHPDVVGYVYDEAVLCEHGVEGRYAVAAPVCEAVIVSVDYLWHSLCHIPQRADDDPLGQCGFGHRLVVEHVVDDEIELCGEIGHVAFERVIRIHGDIEAVDVQSEVWLEPCRHVRVFIFLTLACRQPFLLESVERVVPPCVHDGCAMAVYHATALCEEVSILFLGRCHFPFLVCPL